MRLLLTRSWRAAWAAVVVGVVLATPTTARAEEGPTVLVHQYQYHDAAITVPVGAIVTWTNLDTAQHDVSETSGPAPLQSALLSTGQSFQWQPTVAGTYQYLCSIHPDMVGSVTVTPPPTTTVAPTTTPAPAGSG